MRDVLVAGDRSLRKRARLHRVFLQHELLPQRRRVGDVREFDEERFLGEVSKFGFGFQCIKTAPGNRPDDSGKPGPEVWQQVWVLRGIGRECPCGIRIHIAFDFVRRPLLFLTFHTLSPERDNLERIVGNLEAESSHNNESTVHA